MEKSYRMGYDSFITRPGEAERMYCRVCSTVCSVKREIEGPTNWVSAVNKVKVLHDAFCCPHSGEDWHNLALALILEREKTVSKRIQSLIDEDLKDALKNRRV